MLNLIKLNMIRYRITHDLVNVVTLTYFTKLILTLTLLFNVRPAFVYLLI